jgi:DNA-binding NarL/FixJ family response regulator
MPIRVLIADDTKLMRLTIAELLIREPRIEVVGEAANFAETLKLTTMLHPDVLLLDLHMPDERLHPPELVRHHVGQNTGCVLAISIWNDAAARLLAESLGARELFDKANMATELVPAILRFFSNGQKTQSLDQFR